MTVAEFKKIKITLIHLPIFLGGGFFPWFLPKLPAAPPVAAVLVHGSRDRPLVALTFDADLTRGMLANLQRGKVKAYYDPRILELLKRRQVPATFFLTGLWAQQYPAVVGEMAQNPLFEIGNHSLDHGAFALPCFGLRGARHKLEEIRTTQQILAQLAGKTPTLFRFPGGCFRPRDIALVAGEGLRSVGWDVVSGDAFLRHPSPIVRRVLLQTRNGSIIVLHLSAGPQAPATADALGDILDGLRQKGFTFVKVSDLVT